MIKKILLLILILFPLTTFAQFTVKGKIMDSENIQNLEVILEVGMDVNKSFPATIKGETFYITGELDEPINSMLVFKNAGERKGLKLLVDNKSTYQVKVALENKDGYFKDSWYQIKTNSEFHNVWQSFYDTQAELNGKKRQIQNDFEKQMISKKELDQKISALDFEINQKFKDLAISEPSNYTVAYILNGAPDISPEYLQYYEMLDEDVKNSYWGHRLKKTLNKLISEEYNYKKSSPILGANLESIKGQNINGEGISYTGKSLEAKLTLIDFWASWCAPCRKENVRLRGLNNNYNKKDFKIISFSLDNSSKKWKEASIIDNITWENISDLDGVQSKTMKDFQIKQLPRNILINAEGEIIAVNKFGTDLEEFVKEYLSDS